MTAPITVLAIRRLDKPETTIKAYVDLRIGGVSIFGVRIMRQNGQAPWLAMPAIKTQRAWQNTVELSKPLRDRVTGVVLEAWERGT